MVGRAGTRSSSDQTEPTVSVICLGVFCLIGVACRHLLRHTRVPYTVALLIIGIVLGCLEFGTGLPLGKFGDGVQLWAKIDPDLLLALFLPPLLFEGSFSMEVQQIKKCMAQMLFLAGPGVIISTFCIGCALKLTLPYEWSWQTSLLLGAVLSATDPVAVVALLKELGTSKKMSTIIEGESMMNDGASIVVYHLFYNMMLGRHFSWEAIVKYLTLATVGALGIGIAFAIALVLWLPLVFNDPMINLSLTLAVSYIVYFTAQQGADVSGILAVVTFGMFLAAFARSIFPSDARRILNQCWEVTAYVANTLIFILSGIIMAEGIFTCGNQCGNGSSWAYLILVYVIVQFSRVIIVILLYPALQYFGYGLTWKEAVLLAWSGLRGAVGLAMALSVKRASSGSSVITSETGSLILFLTTGTVFLTIVLNGSIAQFLLTLLGMGGLSHVEKLMLDHAKYDIWKKYLQERENLCDGELGPVNWPSVENYIRPTFSSSCPSDSLDQLNLIATRVQLLKAVQAAYRGMLDDGSITHITANFLMSSVDDAIDAASQEPLCDWRILKALIDFQTYAKVFNVKIFPQRLRTYITMKMMQFACYICVAFLRSHRTARRKVSAFVGETDNMSLVLAESVIEEKEAAKFLEEVLHVFPEVLGLVRTTHVTCSMLHLLKIYVQKFEVEGLLEEKLGTLLHDLLVSCFKKSLNDPLQANNLSTRNVISTHPLLRSLPFEVRGALEGLIKKVINPRDMILCREGSLPQSLLLIQSGLLKFETKSSNSSRSTTRVLAEECILGLYEILSGKPCICDISTDSLVVCYIIEANALFPLLASHPGVENLLWQESVVVLAKLLLPEVFEKVPLHGLRALIADSFSMTTFVREESIVIPENSTVFLLEGVLRNQQLPEVVVEPPALLLASYRSSGSSSSEMPAPPRSGFVHYGYQYRAEMTARLAYIDTSGWSSGSFALPVEHEEMNIAQATAIED